MLACYFYDIFSGDGRECLPVQAGYVSIRKCRSAAELVTLQRVRVEPGYALPGPLKPSLVARALAIHGQRGPSRAYPGSTLAVDSTQGGYGDFLEEQNRQLASSLSTGLRVTVLGGRERFSGLFEAGCRNQAPRDGFTACPENLSRPPRAKTTTPTKNGTYRKAETTPGGSQISNVPLSFFGTGASFRRAWTGMPFLNGIGASP